MGGFVDGFVDVRPQFVVSPLLITRCAEECPKGPHVGFPETNLLGIPFFPEILNIKISCSYNGVRITISGVVCTRMASIGIPGSGLGMFQLSGSFTVLFRCPSEDNDQDPFRLMMNFSWDYYNRVILRDLIGLEIMVGISMQHLGFHSDFIGFYYPYIGGDGHCIDAQKKGILRRSLVREYHGWTSGHGGSPVVTMVVSNKNWLVVWNIWIICLFSWECHHPN